MTPEAFRSACPYLVHFTPQIDLSLGLLSAAQVLDMNSDTSGTVHARFRCEMDFRPYGVDYWKSHSRFVRNAGEAGCCLLVRDVHVPTQSFVLGNNYPLGDGRCLGTTIPLTDNRPGDSAPSREQWFRILNQMFWVFAEGAENRKFVERLRMVSPGGTLYRVRLATVALPDCELESRVRLSAINGGGSNGAFMRGTATYKSISEWSTWPPKEIGLHNGLPASLCATMSEDGGLCVEAL